MNDHRAVNEPVRPEMLRMGRVLRALTQRELAQATAIDQGLISKYENGRPIPDSDLSVIASTLQLPEKFFYRQFMVQAPNGASMIMFRRQQTATIKQQQQVIAEMNRIRDNVSVLLESVDLQGLANLPFLEPDDESVEEAEIAAERVRLELRIIPGPIASMTRLLESVGVVIVHRDMPPKIEALVDGSLGSPRILLLKDNLLGGRQRFSLGHELGHLVMHNALKFGLDAIEAQADRFASALLMPANIIKPKLRSLTMERLIALSAEWHVSVQALVHRAFDLDVITERQKRFWGEQLGKSQYRFTEPTPIPVEKPTLLESLLRLHMNDLRYSVSELSEALALEEWEFRKNYLGEDVLYVMPKPKKAVLRPFADGS